jgi:hypothetical protein
MEHIRHVRRVFVFRVLMSSRSRAQTRVSPQHTCSIATVTREHSLRQLLPVSLSYLVYVLTYSSLADFSHLLLPSYRLWD